MISKDMLKKSAEIADKALLNSLPDPKDCHHKFSPEFEKKIEKLSRKANHPVFRKVVKRAIAIAALLIVIGSLTLFISPDARATFFGWLKSGYEHFVLVSHTSQQAETEDDVNYELTWVPEGYEIIKETRKEKTVLITYANKENNLLKFEHTTNQKYTKAYYYDLKGKKKEVVIKENPAEIYFMEEENCITWKNQNDILFYIVGNLNEVELIKIAENVKEIVK